MFFDKIEQLNKKNEYMKLYYQKNKERLIPIMNKRTIRWVNKNRDKWKAYQRRYMRQRRLEAINILGAKCVVCGESRHEFLAFDHKEKNDISYPIWRWILNNKNIAHTQFQLLCHNHNCSKDRVCQGRMLRYKLLLLNHYGKSCSCCGENKIECLTIHHINGKGRAHRRAIKREGGMRFYQWLKNNDYPYGFKILCWNCNMSEGIYGYCPHTPSIY